MAWIKAFHIIFMVTWFAGLFYLPRLFVYHAQLPASDQLGHDRFVVMERKLFAIMTIGAVLTAIFGLWLLIRLSHLSPDYASQGWLHAKLALVAALAVYHIWCWRLARQLRAGSNRHSHVWFRWFNEVPAIALIAIVILVVVRPF